MSLPETCSAVGPDGEACDGVAVALCDERWFCVECVEMVLRLVAYQARCRKARKESKKHGSASS